MTYLNTLPHRQPSQYQQFINKHKNTYTRIKETKDSGTGKTAEIYNNSTLIIMKRRLDNDNAHPFSFKRTMINRFDTPNTSPNEHTNIHSTKDAQTHNTTGLVKTISKKKLNEIHKPKRKNDRNPRPKKYPNSNTTLLAQTTD